MIEKVPSWTSKIIEAFILSFSSLTTKLAEALVKFLVDVITKTTENISSIVEAISNLIKALIESVSKINQEIKVDELLGMLAFVAIMAAIIYLLSYTVKKYGKNAYAGIIMIAIVLAEIVAAVLILDKMSSSPEAALRILSGIAETVLGFSAVITVITGLASLMQGFGKGDKKFSLGFGSIMKALAVVGIVILGMTVLVWLIGFLAQLLKDSGGDPIGNLELAKSIMTKVGEGLASFVSGFATPILEVFKIQSI